MRLFSMFVLSMLLLACARVPDADAIRETIHAMAAAAEAKRSGDVLEPIAEDFIGNDGELDRAGLERFVRARMLATSIGVSLGSIDVQVDGNRATARFSMTITDGSGRWLPDRRARLEVVTGWKRDGSRWRCYNAKWHEA